MYVIAGQHSFGASSFYIIQTAVSYMYPRIVHGGLTYPTQIPFRYIQHSSV
jgi:hypothetical protein